MFSVPRPRKSIPPIRDVPLTKEEIRRRKIVRGLTIAAALVAAMVLAFLAYRANRRRQIDAAREEAERGGRIAAIEAAIALLEGEDAPADVALAARLHATADLAGAEGHRDAARGLLDRHDASGEGASDHRIAEAYLALGSGNPEAAAREASLLVAGRGPRAAEAGHARALAALAIGNLAEARTAADAAHEELSAPRHQALVLVIAARGAGDLPEVTGDATALRLARARAALERGAPSDAARADAEAALAATDATPAEHAWAALVVGSFEAIDGDTRAAAEHLHAAASAPPPGDELFTIELAEAYFAIGLRVDATTTMASLTSPVSTDASRRALLTAQEALLHEDAEAASRAAEGASASPRRTLILARIAATRAQREQATALFQEAAQTPALATFALAELSAMQLFSAPAVALETVQSALEASPSHPRLAAAAAYALAAMGDRQGALGAIGRGLEAHEGEPLLLVARARVHARAAEWDAAYQDFAAAGDATSSDPQICTERGQAAHALGHFDEAREAYAAALAIDPRSPRALISLLVVQVESHDLDGAGQSFARIDEAHLVSPDIDHLRARWLVEGNAGAAGIPRVQEAIGRAPEDGELRMALARLYYQAESWSDAADAFYAAISRSGDRRLALGMRAISLARGRRAPTVEPTLDQLRSSATADSPLAPRDQAMVNVATAWVQWYDDAYGRVGIFARQALDAVANDVDATLVLAYVDEQAHRDPAPRLTTIRDRSIEARGWLANLHAGALDAEGCADARAYLRAAPEGRFAQELGARVSGCPAP